MSKMLKTFRENTFVTKEFNDYLVGLTSMVNEDIQAEIIPAEADAVEVTLDELAGGYELDVEIRLVDSEGNILHPFNSELNVKVENGSTSGGTVEINDEGAGGGDADVDEDLKFVDGVLKFKVTTGGTWGAGEKIEITLDDADTEVLGVSVKVENHEVLEAIANP